jgi:hypothetical protein
MSRLLVVVSPISENFGFQPEHSNGVGCGNFPFVHAFLRGVRGLCGVRNVQRVATNTWNLVFEKRDWSHYIFCYALGRKRTTSHGKSKRGEMLANRLCTAPRYRLHLLEHKRLSRSVLHLVALDAL